MKEERMFILNMVGEGKINAQEGELLLKALACNCGNMEKLDGIKNKMMDFAKENEPKMKQLAQNIAEKSADVMDSVSKTIKNKVNSEESQGVMSND